jgi:hypothetical protein
MKFIDIYESFLSPASPRIPRPKSRSKARIYIPIYGFVEIPPEGVRIVSLPAVERLQFVYQLATTRTTGKEYTVFYQPLHFHAFYQLLLRMLQSIWFPI